MITSHQVLRRDSNILLGIGLDNAVLDIQTNEVLLHQCLNLLQEPHRGLVTAKMGTFGVYAVTLSLGHDDSVAIMVDGPDFNQSRNQSAGIWLEKQEMQKLLIEAMQGAS